MWWRIQPVCREVKGILVVYLLEKEVATMFVRDPEAFRAAEMYVLTGAFAFGDMQNLARFDGR